MNSWSTAAGGIDDYVWRELREELPASVSPYRQYSSALGTTRNYPRDMRVIGLDSEQKLDAEAKKFVKQHPVHPAVRKGAFRRKQARCLLLGPKTTTPPPDADGLLVEIYWSPQDKIPNQSPFKCNSLTYWRKFVRGAGSIWPVENRTGRGFGRGHGFAGFIADRPPLVTRQRKRLPGRRNQHQYRYHWVRKGGRAPGVVPTLEGWLADPEVDHVFVAHSQGVNLALHILEEAYR